MNWKRRREAKFKKGMAGFEIARWMHEVAVQTWRKQARLMYSGGVCRRHNKPAGVS